MEANIWAIAYKYSFFEASEKILRYANGSWELEEYEPMMLIEESWNFFKQGSQKLKILGITLRK